MDESKPAKQCSVIIRNILFDKEKIAERWVEYIKELYDDIGEPMPQSTTAIGQSILKEEVENVTHLMKNGKATGPDDLPGEALKILDEHHIDILTTLCNLIYNTGYIPTEIKQSIFVLILKNQKHKIAMNTEL